MKKLYNHYYLLLLLGLTACNYDNDVVYDFINYNIIFAVADAEGNDLLNPDVEGNILNNTILIEHNGITYRMGEDANETRTLLPRPLAIRYGHNSYYDRYHLYFGEFAPDAGDKTNSFTINWGDGTHDVVTFDLYVTYKKSKPTVHKKLFLNDRFYSNSSFLIELQK